MDLRTMYSVLSQAPFEGTQVTENGHMLGNLNNFKRLVAAIEDVPSLKNHIQQVKNSAIYSTVQDELSVGNPREAANVKRIADGLYLGALGLRDALSSTIPPVEPESIIVKLPQEPQLSSVVTVLGELEQALEQLVTFPGIDGKVEVSSWETGSLLVILYLKTLAAVDLVARALRSAAVVFQEIQKGRVIGQHVSGLKIKNESLVDLKDAQKILLKELVEREARAVETDAFNSHDPERFERIKNAVRMLADLIDRGTAVYPALAMPAENKERFPDFAKIETMLSETKQIEDSRPDVKERSGSSGASPDT